MPQTDSIQTILKDSNYHLDLFNTSEIQDLNQNIQGNEKPLIYCPIRRKHIQLKPEELIRILKDKLAAERKSLKDIILELQVEQPSLR